MPNSSFMPNDNGGRADLLDHLAATLPKYATLLDYSNDDLAEAQADALAYRHALHSAGDASAYSQHWTAFRNLLWEGGAGSGDWPLPLVQNPPIPPAVTPGIVTRLWATAARIKAHKNYTQAIGQDLWLIGPTQVIDPSTWKPILKIQIKAAHPVILWTKGKASAIEIWVDRGDGNGFASLTINTEPPTNDNTPLPAAGASALWKYKAVYLLHDEQVGQWSDVVSVTVGG